jgi:hypothetical protein
VAAIRQVSPKIPHAPRMASKCVGCDVPREVLEQLAELDDAYAEQDEALKAYRSALEARDEAQAERVQTSRASATARVFRAVAALKIVLKKHRKEFR